MPSRKKGLLDSSGKIMNETELEKELKALRKQCEEQAELLLEHDALLAEHASAIRRLKSSFFYSLTQYPRELVQRLRHRIINSHWMQLGELRQYAPRPLRHEKFPKTIPHECDLPSIAIVTPSYMQGHFLERTIQSVISENYPKLFYVVQDGGSSDNSVEVIKRHEAKITAWSSAPDKGQSDAISRGFTACPGDIMAWLNSDDMLMPGALQFVGEYFAAHPNVDAVYGHRVTIDDEDNEVGRWILPPHNPEILRWADYVPQETLFWRRKLFDKVGGIDTSFHFAIDWDLLVRFQEAGANIVRLPYFIGCFRVHTMQKTSSQVSIGQQEMMLIRKRIHGKPVSNGEVASHTRRFCRKGVKTSFMLSMGIRA